MLIHVCCLWLIPNWSTTPTFHLWRPEVLKWKAKVPKSWSHWFDAQAGGPAQHGNPQARSRYLSFSVLLTLSFTLPLPPPAILLLREVLWSSCARSQASGCIVSPSITIHLTAILSALPKTHSLVLSHPPRQGAMQSKSQPLEPRRAWISMDKPKRQTMDHLEQHTLSDGDWFGEVDTVCGLHDSVRPSLCFAAWWTCNSEGN